MNYRHAFHAGNFADVFKHGVVALVLAHLCAKAKPFVVIDTHAGPGRYDLTADAADRTGEWRDGVARVLDTPPPALAGWEAVVRAENPAGDLRVYPGSPLLARHFLRPGDRLMACELHPEDHRALADLFAGDRRARIYHLDGYQAWKAFLPPRERRGLVLVDPPFERRDEFAALTEGLRAAVRRWATGIQCLWYPIKHRDQVAAFHGELAALDLPETLVAELTVRGPGSAPRFDGSGVVVVNPPWTLADRLTDLLPDLVARLGQDAGAAWRVMPLGG